MLTPFGDLFSEQITKGQRFPKPFFIEGEKTESINIGRIMFFVILLIIGLGILTMRLFKLTIIEGDRYRKLSSGNRIREVKIPASRGIIYDRNATPLVRNVPLFTSKTGEIFFEEKPATVASELSEGVAREYLFGDLFAHAIGFTGEINSDEINYLNQTKGANSYKQGDVVGKIGIEKSYDKLLRGTDGKELYEVDAFEKKIRVLGRIEPIPGQNITLALDAKLQKIAKDELKGKKGAVIATDPATGEILVLYSSPSFDPNVFIRRGDIEAIFQDEAKPMFDRAIAGLYPPGSTFKIVTAIAALESGAINKNTKIEDTGKLEVGNFSYANWYFTQYGKKEGMLDIVGALRRSNDIFFYKAGEATGIENIAAWAKKMGVGTILGIDISGEEKGLMPDPVWQEKTKGETWYLGNTYHVAIGQGDVLTTPLQVNSWTDTIANGGKLCRPYLFSNLSHLCKNLEIKKETVDLIKEGMREACSPEGTGWPLFKFKVKSEKLKINNVDFFEVKEASFSGKGWVEITTACKTGTAEFGDTKNRTHAWITVFAPVANPHIAVTVLVEAGGEGSSIAGPIAKKMLEGWFGRGN